MGLLNNCLYLSHQINLITFYIKKTRIIIFNGFFAFCGTQEESFHADFLRAYRKSIAPNKKPNRSIRMVEIISEEESKKRPSFYNCTLIDTEFSCNGIKKVLNENAFTRKTVLHDFLRVLYEQFNNVCDINIESSKFCDDGDIFTAYAYCNDRACCTFIFKLNLDNEFCKVFRSKEELQHQIGVLRTYQARGPKRHLIMSEVIEKRQRVILIVTRIHSSTHL